MAASTARRAFNRFELKYLFPAERTAELLSALAGRVVVDPHAGPKGVYEVHSIYCDTADYRAFFDKVDGLKVRRKLRFRSYADGAEIFAEIKQRLNRTIQKRRAPWGRDVIGALLSGDDSKVPIEDAESQEALLLWKSLSLRPTMAIHYQRRAFQATQDAGLRITLDSQVSFNHEALDPLVPWRGGEILVPPNLVVLEIKFDHVVPEWLSKVVLQLELKLTRLSKYCRAVDLCHFGGRHTGAAASERGYSWKPS